MSPPNKSVLGETGGEEGLVDPSSHWEQKSIHAVVADELVISGLWISVSERKRLRERLSAVTLDAIL